MQKKDNTQPAFKNFLINLSVVAAVAGVVSFFVSGKYPQINFLLATYLCIYFFLLTAVSHFFITKQTSDNGKFVRNFLLATIAKFLFSLLILLGHVFIFSETAVPFIVLFATLYLLFGAFETASLFMFFRKPD